jgi:hypothetical protein
MALTGLHEVRLTITHMAFEKWYRRTASWQDGYLEPDTISLTRKDITYYL